MTDVDLLAARVRVATQEPKGHSMVPAVWTIYGAPGTAKSSFGLTFPKKLKAWDFDWGMRRAYHYKQLVSSGDVVIEQVILPPRSLEKRTTKMEGMRGFWIGWLADYKKHLLDPEFPSLQVDTGTYLWQVDRDAYLEELQEVTPPGKEMRKQLLQIEYGEPNARMKEVVNLSKQHGKNLILVHHETDEYAPVTMAGKAMLDNNNQPITTTTGRKLPDGFRYTRGLSDWVVYMYIREDTLKDGTKVSVPVARIEKSAEGLHLVGMAVDWPTYDKIEALVSVMQE